MPDLQTEHDVLAVADEVAAKVIAEHAAKVDSEAAFPRASIDAIRDAGLMGLISARDVGGLGFGPGTAAKVIERWAKACGSTGMVMCMHYCGTAVLEAHAPEQVRRDVTAGRHLSTLAFSILLTAWYRRPHRAWGVVLYAMTALVVLMSLAGALVPRP